MPTKRETVLRMSLLRSIGVFGVSIAVGPSSVSPILVIFISFTAQLIIQTVGQKVSKPEDYFVDGESPFHRAPMRRTRLVLLR